MKNISIKQNVEKEIDSIKKHSMTVVKRTLKRNNIIKDGSTAPVEMLRNLYENCTLAGKIVNKSPQILIHNFVNDNKN
jgi:radical SAM superfamily enzyme